MSDFKKIQGELQNAKRNREQSQRVLFLAKERLGKLEREKTGILRKGGINSEAFKLLAQNERRLKADLTKAEEQLAGITEIELDLLDDFQIFVDPLKTIQQFSDDTPFLLFPVRLETRFKKININQREIQHQLWVRVFPDECSVDTFENVLSEAEIKRARNYWLTIWSAGKSVDESLKPFILNQQKAAWKGLAGNIQAGRAYWITKNFIPKNSGDMPERESEDDIILTIPTEELPSESVQTALATYWTAIWLANGKAEPSSVAHSELVATVGEDLAAEILLNYIPFNLKDGFPPQESPFPQIKVTFIQFDKVEAIDSKLSSWSQAARVTTLPDKFVLLGYKGKNDDGKPFEVVKEFGEIIPDPLIIGPNPSLDTNTVLKKSLVEDYLGLTTDELRKAKLTIYYQESNASIQKEKTLDQFINNPELLDEGTILPALEKIFEDLKDEAKAVKYIDYLCQKSETKWLFDFEEAVKVGMGFKINLNPDVYDNGFDRLFVLGVKLSADKMEAKTALEELFEHHHFGSSGFSIMAQGTPTNNTEDEKSGFSENEDFEETFERYILESTEDDPDDFFTRKDGQWLTSLLGIDADKSSIKLAENYYQTDQCEAKAMNTAMWSGTVKYFMESMMTPVFNELDEKVAHSFFTGFVSGRGSIPAIRIGDQPYGILATNTISRQNWLSQEGDENALFLSQFGNSTSVLQKLNKLLNEVRKDFDQFSKRVAHVGQEGDAHQILLDVIGLHASSVEFHQRYAKSFAHLYNLWFFYLSPSFYNIYTEQGYQNRGLALLKELGYSHSEKDDEIPILEKFFLSASNLLKGDLIDDQPLSEENSIRAYTATESENEEGENYIYWLIENASSDYNKIKQQQGFAEHAPTALLYQMLRHALEVEFSNTALNLHKSAEILNSNQIALAKKDADFIGIQARQTNVFESKYDYLDRHESRITEQNISVAEHISGLLQETTPSINTNRLNSIINALNHLKDVPTARLERAFVEHLDCCTYRLDAWLLGFVNLQLFSMRYTRDRIDGGSEILSEGIYLGAYGWVENLKPDNETLETVNLEGELKTIFDPKDENNIVRDNLNAGYIHAPSINQATTAAVLRNAYISNASAEDSEVYKVNLSSERVRMALGIIEGMQQGQSLNALLGYQLERGLHDRYQEAEVDFYIYELRIAFPLNANQLNETLEDDLESITQIEARNVVDGLALVNHVNAATDETNKTYPFGKINIEQVISKTAKDILTSEIDRLININDALADLATAEGIHQVVQGNYDRAAATMDTYSKGSFPQTPEVIKTPRSGVSLTHRVGIHLNADAPSGSNPRAIAEPAINELLGDFLPSLSVIWCHVSYRIPTYDDTVNPLQEIDFTIDVLGLSYLDLFYILDLESDKSLTALDDYILKHVHKTILPRPDIVLKIQYTKIENDKVSLFEIIPLVKSLRTLILTARPLKPTDVTLPNEAKSDIDSNCFIDLNRIISVFNQFKINCDFIDATNPASGIDLKNDPFIDFIIDEDFEKSLKDNKFAIIDGIDLYLEKFLTRLHNLSQFGIPQAGFGFIFDRKATIYADIYKKVLAYKKRWEAKAAIYNALIADFTSATSDEEKLEILQKAERTISTIYTIPVPDLITYKTKLDQLKTNFDVKLGEINNWLNGNFIKIQDLVNRLNVLRTGLENFDLLTIETDEEERQIVVLAEDLKIQAVKLNDVLISTAIAVQELLDQHEVEAIQSKKVGLLTDVVKLLFGEDFKIIPTFQLNPDQTNELANSLAGEDQLLDHQKKVELADLPVDDWLYGIARVREKLGCWENTVILSECFKGVTRDLTAMQFPYQENDSWLALAYPENYEIESDKLLYTAYLNGFDPSRALSGLLIDEWTEVIPTKQETTGLTFQYDQPNAEPPQSMLLVTPSSFTGNWEWDDMVDSMHETLDMAKLRAIEPQHIDQTAYAQFLPATVSAVTTLPFITIALNYAFNNGFSVQATNSGDGNGD